jgi:hypothetical protein
MKVTLSNVTAPMWTTVVEWYGTGESKGHRREALLGIVSGLDSNPDLLHYFVVGYPDSRSTTIAACRVGVGFQGGREKGKTYILGKPYSET